MDSRRLVIAALLTTLLLAGASTLALGASAPRDTPGRAEPEPPGGAPAHIATEATMRALVDELPALRSEVEQLRIAEVQRSAATSRREIAVPEELAAASRALSPALEQRIAPTPTPQPPARSPHHREALDRLASADAPSSSQAHAFWTYQQVLDTYGPPDQMHASQEGGLTWLYHLVEGREAGFAFFDGFVVRVWE